jgi:hypothetical protein
MRARRKGRDGLAAGPPSHVEQSFRGVASLSLRCRSKFHWHCCAQLDCAVHVAGSTVRAARRSRQYTVQCITQYTMYHIIVHAPMLPGWVPAATSVSDLARVARGVSRPHRPSRMRDRHRATVVRGVRRPCGPCGRRAQRSGVHARGDKSDESRLGPDTRPGQDDRMRSDQDASRLNHTTSRDITPRTVRTETTLETARCGGDTTAHKRQTHPTRHEGALHSTRGTSSHRARDDLEGGRRGA